MNESPRAGDETFEGTARAGGGALPQSPLRAEMTVRQVAADYPASCEVFRRHGEPERRSAKLGHLEPLDRSAFWLVAGLVQLAAGQMTAAARGRALPRAYIGATRHALTVGFLTTLILGVGQRLLPILGHDLLAWPRLVVPIFGLIAAGNALRVSTELATLAWPVAFRIMPASAVLELSALSLFAANAFRTLWPRPDPLLRTGRVTPMARVAILLAEQPWLEDHLIAWGGRYIGRVRSVPAELTLASLAIGEAIDPAPFIARINDLLVGSATARGPIGPDGAASLDDQGGPVGSPGPGPLGPESA